MMDYIEFLELPEFVAMALIILFIVMQVIGEILEFKGKIVPEAFKIRKYFARKKREREIIASLPETFDSFREFCETVNQHYSDDNITKRNAWMQKVNDSLDNDANSINELSEYVKELYVDNKRNMIIDFASNVVDSCKHFTREQFNRIFKVYEEYEEFINRHDMTNGEIDVAIRIIKEAYEKRMREHTFIEEMEGYED